MNPTIFLFTSTLITILNACIRGWVISLMWGWFVVGVFGLPPIGILQAIGISMIVGYLTFDFDAIYERIKNDTRNQEEKLIQSIAIGAILPLIILFFAWIIHVLM